MELTIEDIDNYAVNNTRKIAGQSLTEDPSTPAPYLKPPKFTGREEAINYFFDYITDEERFGDFMDILEEGVPVMDVVQFILMNSFRRGEINPDMMMMLAEPVAYILLGFAERHGIVATIVEDDEDPEVVEDDAIIKGYHSPIEEGEEGEEEGLFRSKLQTITNPKDDEDNPMKERIENMPSLLDKGEE